MPQLDFVIFFSQCFSFFIQFFLFSLIYEDIFFLLVAILKLRKKYITAIMPQRNYVWFF